MKARECENCGSHDFHKIGNQWICDYCQTAYIEESAAENFTDKVVSKKKINPKSWLFLLLILIFVFVKFYGFQTEKTPSVKSKEKIEASQSTTATSLDPSAADKAVSSWQKTLQRAGLTDDTSQSSGVSKLGNWAQSIYDTLTVATENYDAQSEKYNYVDGANFDDLIKKVGQADSISVDRNTSYGMPVRGRATWDQDSKGQNAGVTITVTYIEANKMIINKELNDY